MPQIEIMQADLPHTLYIKRKDDEKGDKAKKVKASDDVLRLQEEANRRALERQERKRKEQEEKAKAEEEPPVTVEELFARENK